MTAPLEYLKKRGKLADPDEEKIGKADLVTAGNSLRRYQTGGRLKIDARVCVFIGFEDAEL